MSDGEGQQKTYAASDVKNLCAGMSDRLSDEEFIEAKKEGQYMR